MCRQGSPDRSPINQRTLADYRAVFFILSIPSNSGGPERADSVSSGYGQARRARKRWGGMLEESSTQCLCNPSLSFSYLW
jgi:hypothetical protein